MSDRKYDDNYNTPQINIYRISQYNLIKIIGGKVKTLFVFKTQSIFDKTLY